MAPVATGCTESAWCVALLVERVGQSFVSPRYARNCRHCVAP